MIVMQWTYLIQSSILDDSTARVQYIIIVPLFVAASLINSLGVIVCQMSLLVVAHTHR